MNDAEIASKLRTSEAVVRKLRQQKILPTQTTGMRLGTLLRSNSFLLEVQNAKRDVVRDSELAAKAKHEIANKRAELYQRLSVAKECRDFETAASIHEALADLNETTEVRNEY